MKFVNTLTIFAIFLITLMCGIQLMKARDAFPSSAAEWDARACEKFERGDYEEALIDWDSAVQADPDNSLLYWRRSRACREVGRNDQAVDDATHALSLLTPNDKSADRKRMFYLHARALGHDKRGDYQAALEDFKEAIALAEGRIDAAPLYFDRGRIELAIADTDLAIADFSMAIKLVPTWGLAYHNRAKAYDSKSEFAEGARDHDIAMKMDYDPVFDKFDPVPIRSTL